MDINKINELDQLQQKYNDGRGISHIRHIITYLKRGDIESAKIIYQTEGDKNSQYPELEEWLWKEFGCRLHLVINCKNSFCQKSREYWLKRIKG